MVGRQLPIFSLIVPFWVVWAFAGWKGMKEVWPAILVTGLSFAIPQFLISNYINPWIVDIGASLISMGCLILFLKVWQPKELWLSPALRGNDESASTMPPAKLIDQTPLTSANCSPRCCRGSSCAPSCWSGATAGSRAGRTCDLHLELPGSRTAQHDQQGGAGGREADAGGRDILLHLPVVHRHGNADRRDHFRLHHGAVAGQDHRRIRAHHQAVRGFADHDLGDAGDRHPDPPFRRRCDARSRLCGDRRALSLLRHPAGLARRGADGIGYRRRTSCSAICRRSRRSNSACRRS